MSKRWLTLLGIGTALIVALIMFGSTAPADAKGSGGSKSSLGLIKLYNQSLINAVIQMTGLTAQQVKDDLKTGQSLEDIVKDAGKGSIYDVEAVAKKTITDAINQLITDGKLTQKNGDKLIGNLDKRLHTAVQKHHRPHKTKKGKGSTKSKGSKTI